MTQHSAGIEFLTVSRHLDKSNYFDQAGLSGARTQVAGEFGLPFKEIRIAVFLQFDVSVVQN